MFTERRAKRRNLNPCVTERMKTSATVPVKNGTPTRSWAATAATVSGVEHGWQIRQCIHDVTDNADAAQALALLMQEGGLDPCHMHDVVEDFLNGA